MADEQKEPISSLSVRLGDELILLDEYKTGRIREIIEAPSILHQKIQRTIPAQNADGTDIEPEYTFDVNNTLAHSLCGDYAHQNGSTASRQRDARDNIGYKRKIKKSMCCCLCCVVLFFAASPFLFHDTTYMIAQSDATFDMNSLTWRDLTLYFWTCMVSLQCCLVAIIWLVIQHCYLNKKAVDICIRTFDYWIKMIYYFIFAVSLFYSEEKTNSDYYSEFKSLGDNGLAIMYQMNLCFQLSAGLLVVSFISLFDAAYVSNGAKFTITLTVGMMCFCGYFLHQFVLDYDYEIIMKFRYGERTISMKSLILSSLRIVGIFFWKQAYKLGADMRKDQTSDKNTATTITITPTIKWVGADQEIQQIQRIQRLQQIEQIEQNQFVQINTTDDDVADDNQIELATCPHLRRNPANASRSISDELKENMDIDSE